MLFAPSLMADQNKLERFVPGNFSQAGIAIDILIMHADWLTEWGALWAGVLNFRTPSSPVRERERERER
jgi:hypothetical protein